MHFYKIVSLDFPENRKKALVGGGGVYVIRCLSKTAPSNAGPYVPVPRILATDEGGILYIGKASHERRLAHLLMSIAPYYNGKGHAFGYRYKSDTRFQEKYPNADLIAELIPSKDPDLTETTLLDEYEIKFGELPPFNHSKRKSKPIQTLEPRQ